MTIDRGHRRHTPEELEPEIERPADTEADREYTTPERLAALRGEPDVGPPSPEDVGRSEVQARAAPGGTSQTHRAEPSAMSAVDARLEQSMLEQSIQEGIADFEREGSCAPRGGGRSEPRAVAARADEGRGDRTGSREGRGRIVREGGGQPEGARGAIPAASTPVGRAEPSEGGERAPSAPHSEKRVAQPGAMAQRGPRHGRRIDYRSAAPDAVAAMSRLEAYVRRSGLEATLLELVRLRASQINRCAYCIDMHTKDARARGETEQRLYLTSAWREAPCYSVRERAALEWTEALTLLPSTGSPDDAYERVRTSFSEQEIVALTLAIVAINGWNRLAVGLRSPVGSYQPSTPARRSQGDEGAAGARH